jgi:subtilisin-like proprotein convertase family protein
MDTKLRLVLSTTILFFSFYGVAQTSYWKRDVATDAAASGMIRRMDVRKAETYSLSSEFFEKALPLASSRKSGPALVYFPDSKGQMLPFEVWETPVLAPELAARYPGIRSYSGRSLRNPEERIRFSLSHRGLQSMLVQAGEKKNTFMQKIPGSGNQYLLYQRDGISEAEADFICYTSSMLEKQASGGTQKLVNDQLLRKYRIAVSATGEYTQYHGGSVPDALAAINATLTRVNEVFETDLAITLELVANTDQVIFTNATTDPYGSNLNTEVQNTLSSMIGEAGYDVGHLFHRASDSGNAGFIASVCKDNQKGSGFSSAQIPEGDVFDLDFVAHELGHQFGANHTWSFESEGTEVQAEPGSGSTIMGYAGIVEGENVQPHGDDYFHYFSILQITDYVKTVSCTEAISLTNNPPAIVPSGDFIIPKGTAFVLTGDASDPDATDVLTYAWEQTDSGIVTAASFGPTNASGANFRSRRPDTVPYRYFPGLEEVIQGNLTQSDPEVNTAWETVSEVERDLNFALTVRDNAIGGGQVASDLVKVRVMNNAGPFVVSSQDAGETYMAGTVQPIVWEVAGTDAGLVSAQEVDIFLSLDGGISFPVQLADATPNDGSHEVLLPGTATSNARIMVKADNNIFFAVNKADFSIMESQAVLQFAQLEYSICQPDELQIPFSYETFGGFNEEVTFSASGAPAALGLMFSPETATAGTTPVTLSITNTDQVPAAAYNLTVTATSTTLSRQVELKLQVLDGTFEAVALSAPANEAVNVSLNALLEWNGDPTYASYDLEIATDPAFTSIVENTNVIFTNYRPLALQQSTTYYWRVKPLNLCGEGTFSTPSSFSTIPVNCQAKGATGLPIPISSVGTPEIESTIAFLDDLPVADVNVTVDLDHTFLGDLVITIVSPAGTEVVLSSNSCGEFSNMNAVFDDDAMPFVCGNNPAIGGTVRPLGSLATFNGESASGNWTLKISDTAPADGGALNGFNLEICVEGDLRPDDDGDGIFDDGDDLCPGTPPGTEVNPDGCPVYRFDPENFRIALNSESCIPSNNGSIEITANEILDYNITLNGPGINVEDAFTSLYQLGNLAAGSYNICITGSDGIIEFEPFCFEVNIGEPEPLVVSTSLSADGQQAVLQLEGADLYLVELNGIVQQVTTSEIMLDLKEGNNTLKVSTSLPCQGKYDEKIYVPRNPVLFPNPFNDELTINVGPLEGELEVAVYDAGGSLLERKKYVAHNGQIRLDFIGRPSGVYLIGLLGYELKGTFKVVKR